MRQFGRTILRNRKESIFIPYLRTGINYAYCRTFHSHCFLKLKISFYLLFDKKSRCSSTYRFSLSFIFLSIYFFFLLAIDDIKALLKKQVKAAVAQLLDALKIADVKVREYVNKAIDADKITLGNIKEKVKELLEKLNNGDLSDSGEAIVEHMLHHCKA